MRKKKVISKKLPENAFPDSDHAFRTAFKTEGGNYGGTVTAHDLGADAFYMVESKEKENKNASRRKAL